MRVLALASQKGGSGKTTLSGHLAVQAQLSGAGPVCLIDIDPQGSLADWWNERDAEMPAFAQTTVARLASDLEVLRQQGFRLAVIDTPPAITMAIQSVIAVAELIVIPTRPSPHDLRAVGATVDLCDRAGKPLIFVVNAATPKAKITYEAAVALSQHGTVAPVTVHHRTDFAASMIDGRTVMEIDPNGRSAARGRPSCGNISPTGSKRISAAPSSPLRARRRECRRRRRAPSAASAAASSASKRRSSSVSEPKPFASLSSGLLARKGAARPAMRPQGFTPSSAGLEDLGWNDMGQGEHAGDAAEAAEPDEQVVEHPRAHHIAPACRRSQSPVHSQQAELADRLAESDEDFDEEYDETAEPYEPEAGSGGFNGFPNSADEDEEADKRPSPSSRSSSRTARSRSTSAPRPESPPNEPLELEPEPVDRRGCSWSRSQRSPPRRAGATVRS